MKKQNSIEIKRVLPMLDGLDNLHKELQDNKIYVKSMEINKKQGTKPYLDIIYLVEPNKLDKFEEISDRHLSKIYEDIQKDKQREYLYLHNKILSVLTFGLYKSK